MSNTNRANVTTLNDSATSNNSSKSQNLDDTTIIRRRLVEHGLRPVNDGNTAAGQSSITTAIATITQQHQTEQRELQELNKKFAVYLDRVQYLEDYNQRLVDDLATLKEQWGGDATILHAQYGPDLQALRKAIDNALRDHALQELQLKRQEYDLYQIQQQLATFEDDDDINRLNFLKQELAASSMEIELLSNLLDQRFPELAKQQALMDNLLKELNGLKNELDTHQLERIIIETELQTLKEHTAFQNSIHQAQRKELLSLSTPVIDASRFYRIELARAISDIRQDFDILSQSQTNELEEYYRIKTEEVRAEIESENERKRLLASQGVLESMDTSGLTSALRDNQNDLLSLQAENKQLQSVLDAIVDDIEKIQEEQLRERQFYDHEFASIREQIIDKQETIDNILQNNVSLRFEMSTYRRLLDVEEKRINKVDQGQPSQSSSSASASASTSASVLASTSPSSYQNQPTSYQNQPASVLASTSPSSYQNQPTSYQNQPAPASVLTSTSPSSYQNQPTSYQNQTTSVLASTSPASYQNQSTSYQNQTTSVSASTSPASYQNQPTSYQNQTTSYENQPLLYQNQPTSYQNQPPSYQTQTQPTSYQNQPSTNQVLNDLETKKMTVQKTARGPISFDSVDLETDAVILVNERYSGNEQSLQNWTIQRQVDQQPKIIYQFPPSFSLRSRQTVRIFSKRSPYSAKAIGDRLIADRVDTWGIGHTMVTRLIDDNNEEKAIITQIFQ